MRLDQGAGARGMNLLCVLDARKEELDDENRGKGLAWRKGNNWTWNGANKEEMQKKLKTQHDALASDRATSEQKQGA